MASPTLFSQGVQGLCLAQLRSQERGYHPAASIGADSLGKSEKNSLLALEQELAMPTACLMTPALLHGSHHPTEQA